jgi:hypothetical protein
VIERLAEHAGRLLARFVGALDQLDAAPLAATARVDLRLHDRERVPELFVGLARRLASVFTTRPSGTGTP